MMAVPGDMVFLEVITTGSVPVSAVGTKGSVLALLLTRVTDDALHEDDDYDNCLLLPVGETRLRRSRGMFVKKLEAAT